MRMKAFATLPVFFLCLAVSTTWTKNRSHPTDSDQFSFEDVLGALGGKEKILAIKGFQASMLYSSYSVERFSPRMKKNMDWWDRHNQKDRRRAEEQAAKRGPQEAAAVKALPPLDPAKYVAFLHQRHIHIQVDLPSQARSTILNLAADKGLDIIDFDGSNWNIIRSQNQMRTERRPARGQGDLSYALPLLGMLRSILLDKNYTAEFSSGETIGDTPLRVFKLNVRTGPYVGLWVLKVHGHTRLPVSLEYAEGLPLIFLGADGYVFSADTVQPKSAAKEKPTGYWPDTRGASGVDRFNMDESLREYRQQMRFVQSFGVYRQKDGIPYPTLAKVTISIPTNHHYPVRTNRFISEWHSTFVIMSLDWNPVEPCTRFEGRLAGTVGIQTPPAAAATASATYSDKPGLSGFVELRRFYTQLVWNAVLTPSQHYCDVTQTPPYFAIGPGWARFYSVVAPSPEGRPISSKDFSSMIRSHRDAVLGTVRQEANKEDLRSLEKAFGDLESVAKQALTVYALGQRFRWDTCFDANNVAIASARILQGMDRQAQLLGLNLHSAQSLLAESGIDTAKLVTYEIDFNRNTYGGMSIASRVAILSALPALFLFPVPTLAVMGTIGAAAPGNPGGTQLAETTADQSLERLDIWGNWAANANAIPKELVTFDKPDVPGF